MVEIAISLAIIGIALVSIIGVLPIGMNTQRDNREETIVNQDATVLMEAIRGGAQGMDDLTNYVYGITNYWTEYSISGGKLTVTPVKTNGYATLNGTVVAGYASPATTTFGLTNGVNIIGLLSTPEFTDVNGRPLFGLVLTNNATFYSNHVVAYVHSLSGPAVEKPPQTNDLLRSDSFSYRVLCINAPVNGDMYDVTNFNGVITNGYFQQLSANLRELRLAFFWPQQPNGTLGPNRQSFRTQVAGQIFVTNNAGQFLYFYQPQSFLAVTNN